ncbi:hypothetical protein Aph01nite_04780 [Acrocarpospora phusangensis]|uniref:EfeO-type cupredoxin-like domain-containing protein n=1 Tax=Acrocarpospora phusangensis TaxID=1070424 RepID=A0A919Q739_9ACTN|nr:hypothetical protein [Acrocarpospora phusangensis]GIH22168.1 hypothetical protein Aph01nite_04780 [Acrocarpospora phusangensis]
MKSLIAIFACVVLAVTGCSASGDPATFSGPAKEITVTIAGGSVNPPPGRVEVAKGQQVKIVVTSDVPDELHVHGYDMSAGLQPNTPATVEFVADRDGLFEVETHDSEMQLFQLQVQ